MTGELKATAFHARAAEHNRLNDWENRNGFTLAASYSRVEEEALAARFGAVIADISWHWRVQISGTRAEEFVSRVFTRDVAALEPGTALETLWLNDAGAVRGAGTVVRYGRDSFVLLSVAEDAEWFAQAARLYGVEVRGITGEEGVLALIGPAARKILDAAELAEDVQPSGLRKLFWRGLDITLSRLGLGYEIWCAPDDALIVWDRLVSAGRTQALLPAGQAALDILEFENGLMRPGRDYRTAADGFATAPTPQSLGLCGLVDREHLFNGRAGYLAAGPFTALSGVLLDSEDPAPYMALTHEGQPAGRTLASRTSPAMRRAVAFAVLAAGAQTAGLMAGTTPARAIALPFLPIPAPMDAPTEAAQPAV